jgi:hypothetical protein
MENLVFISSITDSENFAIDSLFSITAYQTHSDGPMEGIDNTLEQVLKSGGFASSCVQRAGYLTLLSHHSLGRETITMLPFHSLR